MTDHHSNPSKEDVFFFKQQEIAVPDFPAKGSILDVGGGGQFHIWDAMVPADPAEGKPVYAVMLKVAVKGRTIETGYGQRWPGDDSDLAYYRELAQMAGFQVVEHKAQANTFFLHLQKPTGEKRGQSWSIIEN